MGNRAQRLRPTVPMAYCQATCAHGGPCAFKAKTGQIYCGKHLTPTTTQTVLVCGKTLTKGTPCTKPREIGAPMCSFHIRVERERNERETGRRVWAETLDLLWTTRNADAARTLLGTAYTNGELTEALFIQYAPMLDEEIDFMGVAYQPPPVLKGDLHALALDSQNVHTGAINTQTEAGLNILLTTDIPATQVTLDELDDAWAGKTTAGAVLLDVRKWYRTKTCRQTNDTLYRRTLDGLWARIKETPALVERLWEECNESVGMCCEGHISRLCNVLVGFDEAFKPVVSAAELLQQRISGIAAKDAPSHVKVGEAWAVFEELSVPMDKRMAWLEAL